MHAGAGKLADLQPLFAARQVKPRVLLLQLAADHHFDKQVFLQLTDRPFGDKLPVTEHRDVIADFEDLLQPVRNINNAASLGLQLVDHFK
ncbi:hypothetical protein D3C80_1892810 [compost metagenome]